MTTQSTIDKLIEMRLTSMSDAFLTQLQDARMRDISFEDRFGMLVDIEYSNLCQSAHKRYCFISFDSLNGCAKEIVAKCKKAGVVMTGAGATYPYGKDPEDRNIRIAPSYPPLQDLITATELFALCVKLVSVNKLLEEM